jgi:hypothetical protein
MRHSWRRSRVPTRLWGLLAAIVILATAANPVSATPTKAGFLTDVDAMLDVTTSVAAAGGGVTPIITVGETIGDDGYRFEAIPDGISFIRHGRGTVDLYVNHETSTVPFPLAANGSAYVPTTNSNGSQNDFDNSQLSWLRLHQQSRGVLDARYAISSDALYQRFCSNFMVGPAQGFSRRLLFTNEEAVDWVNTTDPAFIAFPGAAGARQIGNVVAFDPESGEYRTIWGMGRLNHENSVGVPGYGHPVVLTTDDTFTNAPSQSQLYSYIADDADAVWNDRGTLWAFVSDNAAFDQYEDFLQDGTLPVGGSVSGHFIEVPREIATGKLANGSEISSATVPADLGGPYPAPPGPGFAASSWQTFNNVHIDGPQWVLEWWSKTHNVFEFVRLEDVAYDKRPGMGNVVYLVDSGRGTGAAAPPLPQGNGISTNGRVWKMVLDPEDPTIVDSLSILIEGDDRPVRDPARIHQPDNIESTPNGLYITEDPGSQQNFPFGSIDPSSPNFNPAATNARIWQYKLTGAGAGTYAPVAVVNQSLDESTDVSMPDKDPVPAGTHGFWEASGIVDVSSVFGPGTFLVTIQAHSFWVDGENGPDNLTRTGGAWSVGSDGFPDWINKREGGQLVLLRIPGA